MFRKSNYKSMPDNEKTHKKLAKMPDIYALHLWAGYGKGTYKFAGKYVKRKLSDPTNPKKKFIWMVPLVWHYNDHNGTYPEYILMPIDYVTTGQTIHWSFSERKIDWLAKILNKSIGR